MNFENNENGQNYSTNNNMNAQSYSSNNNMNTQSYSVNNNMNTQNYSTSNTGYEQNYSMNTDNNGKKFNFKLLAIVAAVVALVVGSFLLLNKGEGGILKKGNKEKIDGGIAAIYDTDKPIPIEENGLYGFISPEDGSVIVSPKYTEVYGYYGEYAFVKSSDGNSIIDRKGNVVKEVSMLAAYYSSNYNVWLIDSKLYDSKLNLLSGDNESVSYKTEGSNSLYKTPDADVIFTFSDYRNNTEGIMSPNGKKVYTISKDEGNFTITPSVLDIDIELDKGERYCSVVSNVYDENVKSAIVNCDTGKVVMDFVNKRIEAGGDNSFGIFSPGLPSGSKNLEKVIYISGDKVVYEEQYDSDADYELLMDYNTGYLMIKKDRTGRSNDEYKYYVFSTKQLVDKEPKIEGACKGYTECYMHKNNLVIKECSSEFKGVYKNDVLITSCDYEDIIYISPDVFDYVKSVNGKTLFIGEKNKKSYIIDATSGKELAEFNSNDFSGHYVSTFMGGKNSETKGKIFYNAITNKSMEFQSDADVSWKPNYLIVKQNGKETYYNIDFKEIYSK